MGGSVLHLTVCAGDDVMSRYSRKKVKMGYTMSYEEVTNEK